MTKSRVEERFRPLPSVQDCFPISRNFGMSAGATQKKATAAVC
jgi:hypothetical protein